ncbi:MAG: hypothetical protein ICV78_15350 [Tolypothrix sp. Co-bin9]|nr:hypothetical protein [Tolypothrix sp. Co-bin9]
MSQLETQIIKELKAAQPTKTFESASATNKRSIAFNVTADELDAAFDTIESRLFSFTTPISKSQSPKLSVNTNVQLTEDEKMVAKKLITGFEERLQAGEISFTKTADSIAVGFPQEAEATISDTTDSLTLPPSSSSAVASENDALLPNCTWRWCSKKRWYGLRLRLNHCAVQYITAGGSIAALKIPPPFNAIVAAVVTILKTFDRGCGVQIHATWTGQIWVKSKSCSKCN